MYTINKRILITIIVGINFYVFRNVFGHLSLLLCIRILIKVLVGNSSRSFFKHSKLLLLIGKLQGRHIVAIQICIDFITIRLYFRLQVFSIVYWFARIPFLHSITGFIPDFIIFFCNYFFSDKIYTYLISLKLFLHLLIFGSLIRNGLTFLSVFSR